MRLLILTAVAPLLLLGASAPSVRAAAPAPAAAVDPVFGAVAAELAARTSLPVLLPRRLPDIGQGPDPVYATLAEATPASYRVVLGLAPGCDGGTACRLGEIAARAVDAGGPPPPEEGQAVTFANGIVGRFVDATCGASCSDAMLTWRAGAVERSVGVKAGRLEDVMALAAAVADGVAGRPGWTPERGTTG